MPEAENGKMKEFGCFGSLVLHETMQSGGGDTASSTRSFFQFFQLGFLLLLFPVFIFIFFIYG